MDEFLSAQFQNLGVATPGLYVPAILRKASYKDIVGARVKAAEVHRVCRA